MINRLMAEKEARLLGCRIEEFEQFPHSEDKHLYSVVAVREKDDMYIAWMFNTSTNSLSTGRYCFSKSKAYEWHMYRLGRGRLPE